MNNKFTDEEIALYLKDREAWFKLEEEKYEAALRKSSAQLEIDLIESIIKYTKERRPDLVVRYRALLEEYRCLQKQA